MSDEVMVAQPYPWDLDRIQPGWSCPVEELEDITGEVRNTTRYRRKVIALRTRLAKDLYSRDGVLYTIREVDGALRVLTAIQAIAWTRKESERDRRREKRRIGEVTFALSDPELPADVRERGQRTLMVANAHRASERGLRAVSQSFKVKAGRGSGNGSAPALTE